MLCNERETCNKQECDRTAVMVLKIYTDEGPSYIAFCGSHVLTASNVIEMVVQSLITGEED